MITEYPTYEAFHSSNSCKAGNCTQCGLCCIAFRVIVPSKEGNPDSPTTVKQQGDICPQLQSLTHGKYRCVLHDKKDHKALATCKDWNGNVVRWDSGRTQHEELCRETARWICYPDCVEQVDIIERFIQRGSIPVETLALFEQILSRPTNIALILKRYIIGLKILSINIFDFIGFKECFYALDEFKRRQILREIDAADPQLLHGLFDYLNVS
ncbi:hypothetical protein KKC44_00730 [Patescibacteria group bacterium]|nr:hypothetical protein [Patescibacteria group bacterium]MBU2259108.1 hypothetical protein [Patescibacteria group bacterium]